MSSPTLLMRLNWHLTDLQLSNDPNQYLIAQAIARLMELEDVAWQIEAVMRKHYGPDVTLTVNREH